MKSVLLDTHAWVWSLTADSHLSAKAVEVMEQADVVYVSVVSLFEIGQKVRVGKWPQMQPFLDRLIGIADQQGARFVEVSPRISLLAATLEWEHRDPFDRIIGATAITRGCVLVSVDPAFDMLVGRPEWLGRLW